MQSKQFRILSAVLLTLVALPALAAAEGGESNIFAGDLGNAIWTVVVFLGALFVLSKYAWGPLLDTMKAREDFIHDSLVKAKEDREAAEARLKEYEERLTEARAEATAIVEEGRRDAEVTRGRIEEEARQEAAKTLDRARREIEIARETAVKELYDLSGRLATDIASRIVGRELKAEDHERLVRDAIGEIGQLEQ